MTESSALRRPRLFRLLVVLFVVAGLAMPVFAGNVDKNIDKNVDKNIDKNMVRIASGREGFTYRSIYAPNLEKLMRGYKFLYVKSEGSGQNLEMLADGRANVAFAQMDAYQEKLASDPKRFGKVLLIGRIAPECIFVARRKDGTTTSLDSLAAKAAAGGATMAVGDEGSGMSSTWSYLRQRIPGLAAVEIDHTRGTLALNQLAIGAFDAVGWVTDPTNDDQKMLRAVLANDALELMPIKDVALVAPLPSGVRVYEARTVDVEGAGGSKQSSLETVCTSAMLFTRTDADPRLIDKLSDEVSLNLDKILPHSRSK